MFVINFWAEVTSMLLVMYHLVAGLLYLCDNWKK